MSKKKNNKNNKTLDKGQLHTESGQKKEPADDTIKDDISAPAESEADNGSKDDNAPQRDNEADKPVNDDISTPAESEADGAAKNDNAPQRDNEADKPDKENTPRHEDSLDMHFMTRWQRIAYKRAQHKEKTRGMTAGQRLRFFFDYYKWQTVLAVSLIAFVVLLGRSIYLGTRPMALGLIVLNDTPSEETELSVVIEADYRKCNDFDKHDRFMVITGLSIDPINYESETIAAGSNGLSDYETLYYLTSAGSIDVLLSDYDGLSYCVEQDLVYPIDMLFTEDELAPYEQRLKVMTSYTGEERSYAIDVSDSPYLKEKKLGYTSAYVTFPSNDPESTARAIHFLEFLLQGTK